MADITLSKAVRSNLLSLQSTATQMAKTQERLATGLKVNSALDNPTNFFTSSSLNSRAGDLSRLLDAVSNATQTIEAANNGLTAITSLVESAQATARQALQTTGATTVNTIVGSTDATFNPKALANVAGDVTATGTGTGVITADAAASFGLTSGTADTTTAITQTGAAQDTIVTTAGSVTADATIAAFDSDAIADTTVLSAIGANAIANSTSLTFTVNGTAKTVNFITGSAAADLSVADTLTFGIGDTIENFATALNSLFTTDTASGITVTRATGGGSTALTFTSDSTTDVIHVADSVNGAILQDLGLELGDVTGAINVTSGATTGDWLISQNAEIGALAAAGETLDITTTTGGTDTITFGYATGHASTLATLATAINNATTPGATAAASGTTALAITGATAGESITFAGAAATTALGLSTTAYTPTSNTLSSLGIASGDSFVVAVDGTDYTVSFNATGAATQGTNSLSIGVNATLSQLATALDTTLSSAGVDAAVAATGALTINSSTATSADSIRIYDGSQGTNVAELGLGAIGAEYQSGTTTDRFFSRNSAYQTLAAAGATLNISVGSDAQTQIVFGAGSGEVNTKEGLIAALNNLTNITATGTATGTAAITVSNSDASDADSNIVFTTDSSTTLTALGLSPDSTTAPTIATAATPTNLLTQGKVGQGDTLNIKVGTSTTLTVTFGSGSSQVSTLGELNTKLQSLAGGSASVDSNGEINITADKAGDSIVIGGTTNTIANFGLTAGETSTLIDGTVIAAGDTLNIQVGTNAPLTVTFGTGTGQVNTFSELETALSNLAGGTATIDGTTGAITIEATNGTDDITVTSDSSQGSTYDDGIAEAFGLVNSPVAVTATTTDSTQRASLETQYNDLLTQINELAEDASFNGVNLLDGNDLNVIFNEDGSSTLDIKGVTFNATGLNLSRVASGSFQTDSDINDVLDALDSAISSLRSQATAFGSNLSVVETRQDFTKSMINTLETGAANLTLADTNEEAANLLALQTRQQLSSTALSLASQADQNVLRLF